MRERWRSWSAREVTLSFIKRGALRPEPVTLSRPNSQRAESCVDSSGTSLSFALYTWVSFPCRLFGEQDLRQSLKASQIVSLDEMVREIEHFVFREMG